MDVKRIVLILEFLFYLALVTAILIGAISAATWYITGENLAFLFGG